jgi:hypothetical protein
LLTQAQLAGSQVQNQMFGQNLAAGQFGNTALSQQNQNQLANHRRATLGDVSELISRGISPTYLETANTFVLNQRCIRNGSINIDFARRHNEKVKKVQEDLIHYIKSVKIAEPIPMIQNKTLEIRYTRKSDFTDQVAREFLNRKLTRQNLEVLISNSMLRWNFTQCCLPRFRAGDKPKQRRERLATKRTRNTLRKVAMKEPIVSTHDSVIEACVDMLVEPSTVDTTAMISNYAMQHHSDSDVSFRTGLEMQTRCDNLEPVELSSPLSLHHMVREESRHSNTRDDCDTTYYLSNTAALEPNELVSSRLEIAQPGDLRLLETRFSIRTSNDTTNIYAMEVPPKRRRLIITDTKIGDKESQSSNDYISIAGQDGRRKSPRTRKLSTPGELG